MGAAIVDSQSRNSYGLNQDKMAADATMQNYRLPIDNAQLANLRQQGPYMAAQIAHLGANTDAVKQATKMGNVKNDPVQQFTWGLYNGDERAMRSGLMAADLEQKMRIQQIIAQGSAYQMRSSAGSGEALAERRQEQALKEANDAVDKALAKNVEFGMLPPGEQVRKRAELVNSLYPEFYAKLAKGGPGSAPAPVAAAQPVVQYDPKTRKYK
jgi:hypothetical protein